MEDKEYVKMFSESQINEMIKNTIHEQVYEQVNIANEYLLKYLFISVGINAVLFVIMIVEMTVILFGN